MNVTTTSPAEATPAEPTITIEIVPEATCPTCGAGDDYHNRPKVGDSDGTWWWRCYNPVCPTAYYDPDTGRTEKTA